MDRALARFHSAASESFDAAATARVAADSVLEQGLAKLGDELGRSASRGGRGPRPVSDATPVLTVSNQRQGRRYAQVHPRQHIQRDMTVMKSPPKASSGFSDTVRRASNGLDRVVFRVAAAVIALSFLLELISLIAPYEYPFIGVAGTALLILIAASGSSRRTTKAQSASPPVPSRELTAEEVEARRHATMTSHRFSPEERTRMEGFPVTSWQSAEHSVMMWMRHHGHSDATRTPPGPDGGVDVIATGAIAQVKYYATPIGEPAIVQLTGNTMKTQFRGRQALFFASSGYTPKALMTARDLGVILYELRGGRHWVRVQ